MALLIDMFSEFILKEGLDRRFARHKQLSEAFRRVLRRCDFNFYLKKRTSHIP